MIKIKVNPYLLGIHAKKPSYLTCFLTIVSFVLGNIFLIFDLVSIGMPLITASFLGYFTLAKDKEAALYGLLFALGLLGLILSVIGYLFNIPALS